MSHGKSSFFKNKISFDDINLKFIIFYLFFAYFHVPPTNPDLSFPSIHNQIYMSLVIFLTSRQPRESSFSILHKFDMSKMYPRLLVRLLLSVPNHLAMKVNLSKPAISIYRIYFIKIKYQQNNYKITNLKIIALKRHSRSKFRYIYRIEQIVHFYAECCC